MIHICYILSFLAITANVAKASLEKCMKDIKESGCKIFSRGSYPICGTRVVDGQARYAHFYDMCDFKFTNCNSEPKYIKYEDGRCPPEIENFMYEEGSMAGYLLSGMGSKSNK